MKRQTPWVTRIRLYRTTNQELYLSVPLCIFSNLRETYWSLLYTNYSSDFYWRLYKVGKVTWKYHERRLKWLSKSNSWSELEWTHKWTIRKDNLTQKTDKKRRELGKVLIVVYYPWIMENSVTYEIFWYSRWFIKWPQVLYFRQWLLRKIPGPSLTKYYDSNHSFMFR